MHSRNHSIGLVIYLQLLTSVDAAPEEPAGGSQCECGFCGKSGAESPLTELRDACYHCLHGYCCDSCEESYFRLESRLTYAPTRGRPWLVPDPGTERVVKPFDAVHAVVGGLENEIENISRAAAMIAALRLGLGWEPDAHPAKLAPCDSRQEAVAAISRMIADYLAKHHEKIEKYLDGRDSSVFTVALFGDGCGVLLQQVTTVGNWLQQDCFLIDTEHTVHHYTYWER
jgi:hypothetical protein